MYRVRGDVFFRAGRHVFMPEEHREKNVGADDAEQSDPDDPENRAEALEVLRVGVEPARAKVDREVSEQVPSDKQNQADAREGDDGFLADG